MVGSEQRELVKANRIDYAAMGAAVGSAGGSFAALVACLSENDAATKVPDLTWTVADTAAHMLVILRRGTGDRRRADYLAGLAELNDATVEEIPTRRPDELAQLLAAEVSALTSMLGMIDAATADDLHLKLHAGVHTNVTSGLSYILFDLLVHGYDIAAATSRPWTIDPQFAALDLHAALPIFEPWAKRELVSGNARRVAITFPGDPLATVVDIGGGAYVAQNHPVAEVEGADDVDPVEALLAVAGRIPPTSEPLERLASLYEPI